MSKARTGLGLLLLVGALMSLGACDWLYGLFGDPPTAVLVADPTIGNAPLPVAFDLSDSTAPGGVRRFRIDFGDGSDFLIGTELDEAIDHTYVASGTYTAVLELTDEIGRTDHDTEAVVVGDAAEPDAAGPIALLGADTTLGDAPLVVTFDVSHSSASNNTLVSFRLDFGDGIAPYVGTNFSQPIIHLYATVGLHTALLTVTDADGATGTATLDIIATTVGGGDAPTARFEWTPEDPFIDEDVTFDAGTSTDPTRGTIDPQAIVVYTWEFGDGAEAATTAETIDHTYTWPGVYTVTLTVYDDDGVVGTTTDEITIRGAIAYVSCSLGAMLTEIRLPAGTASPAVSTAADCPFSVAISPDGSFVYALSVDLGATVTTLTKLRTFDLDVVAEADLEVLAFLIAAHPDGDRLYATPHGATGDDKVWVIDPSTLAVLDTILVQSKPNVVTFTPSGDFAYVTCADAWAVVKIDTATRTVVETIDLGEQPWGIAIHPDGGIAYVTTSSDHVLVIDLSDGSFVSIDVGHGPTGVAFTHDGAKAYVANESDGTVSVIDADTHTLTKTIALDDPSLDPPKPLEVVISPGDAVAIVPHGGAPPGYGGPIFWAVSVIDCATDAVIDTLSVGLNPRFADVWGIGY